jgi:hypothetical protein
MLSRGHRGVVPPCFWNLLVSRPSPTLGMVPWQMLPGQMLPRQLLPSDICSEALIKPQSKAKLTLCLALTHTYIVILTLTQTRAYTLNYSERKCRWGASVRGATVVLPIERRIILDELFETWSFEECTAFDIRQTLSRFKEYYPLVFLIRSYLYKSLIFNQSRLLVSYMLDSSL